MTMFTAMKDRGAVHEEHDPPGRACRGRGLTVDRTRGAVVALLLLCLSLMVSPTARPATQERQVGRRAVAHKAGGAIIKDHPARRIAPRSITYPLGHPAIEPTMGVTQEGNVFVTALEATNRIEVLRSKDNGRTWETVSPQFSSGANAHLLSFDPYLHVDRSTSRVFSIDLTVACSYLSFSDDEGESWTTNPLACGRPVNDHQTLFTGPAVTSPTVGYDNAVYYCWNDWGAGSSCSKSLDGGISFSPTGSPAYTGFDPDAESPGIGGEVGDLRGFCGGLHGHGEVGPDGKIYLPKAHCGQPWLAISRDEGATWERVQVADIGGAGDNSFSTAASDPSVAVDRAGNLYYLWVARDRLPYLVVSRDEGATWSQPRMIGSPGLTEANLASIDVGSPGRIAVSYMGSTDSLFQKCHSSTECPKRNLYRAPSWSGYIMVSANALDASPTFFTAAVNKESQPLVKGTCGPGRCPAVYDFIDVHVSHSGVAWATFVDATRQGGGVTAKGEGMIARLVGGPRLN